MGFVSQHCIGFMLTHVISSAIAIVQAMQSITGVPPGSEQREDYESQYDCNICFAVASAPVVTLCGHLYCWPCLYKWMQRQKTCPMCSDFVDKDRVIPIFCRDSRTSRVVDSAIPPRPAALRLLMPRVDYGDTAAPSRNLPRRMRNLPGYLSVLTNANQLQLSPASQRLLQPFLFFMGSLLIVILLLW